MNKVINPKNLAKDLEKYQKDNICKHASNQYKSCTFKMENGCAYNLVINVLSNNLSFDKETSNKQWMNIMGLK